MLRRPGANSRATSSRQPWTQGTTCSCSEPCAGGSAHPPTSSGSIPRLRHQQRHGSIYYERHGAFPNWATRTGVDAIVRARSRTADAGSSNRHLIRSSSTPHHLAPRNQASPKVRPAMRRYAHAKQACMHTYPSMNHAHGHANQSRTRRRMQQNLDSDTCLLLPRMPPLLRPICSPRHCIDLTSAPNDRLHCIGSYLHQPTAPGAVDSSSE